MQKRFARLLIPGIALVALSLAPFRSTSALQLIRVDSALVSIPVIVSDIKGRYIPGLKQGDFKLFHDGAPEKISLFLSSDDPVKIALLLDASTSTAAALGEIKKTAGRFLLQMRPNDMAMVVSFDSEVRILCPFSSDRRELERAIKKVKAGGAYTRLRDSILSLQNRFRSISGRKAIVLLTDGDDHGSATAEPELQEAALSSGVQIYSVFYEIDLRKLMKELFGYIPKRKKEFYSAWTERMEKAAQFLQDLSERSAGRFYRSKVAELDRAFRQISEELHSQYLIGFYPDHSKLDGNLHSLAVKVELQDAVVRNRGSYRARTNDR